MGGDVWVGTVRRISFSAHVREKTHGGRASLGSVQSGAKADARTAAAAAAARPTTIIIVVVTASAENIKAGRRKNTMIYRAPGCLPGRREAG